MKFYTVLSGEGRQQVAVSSDGRKLHVLTEMGYDFSSMNDLLERMTKEQQRELCEKLAEANGGIDISDVKLCAPIPAPKQDVICLGINYMDHAEESARFKKDAFGGDREFAVYFSKRVSEAVADGGSIPSYEGFVDSLDYEVELAVVIGRPCRNVKREDALDYVFGYTILNDMSARNIQTRHNQWYFGKSLDGFTPMGPCIVTRDEIGDPPVLDIKSYVNGELRQSSTTKLLIYDVQHVISELSQGMTLLPGTIISMGTPAGVGMGFQPPKFLQKGDEIVCEIEKIGKLTNVIA